MWIFQPAMFVYRRVGHFITWTQKKRKHRIVLVVLTSRDDLDLLSGLEGLPFHHACSLAVLGQICSTILAQILAPPVWSFVPVVLMNDDGLLLLVNEVFLCFSLLVLLGFFQQKSLLICCCRSLFLHDFGGFWMLFFNRNVCCQSWI